MSFCPKTGTPRIGIDLGELKNVEYDPKKHTIPAHLTSVVETYGWFFYYAYVKPIVDDDDEEDPYVMEANTFRAHFPSWKKVVKRLEQEYPENYKTLLSVDWSEEKHNHLKELLDWFHENSISCELKWSY